MEIKTCKIENCNARYKAKGLCNSHYMTQLRHDNGTYQTYRKPKQLTCSLENCDVKLSVRGLCGAHYYQLHRKPGRLQRINRLHKTVQIKQSSIPCTDCGAPSWSNNMCQLHYNNFKLSPEYAEGLWQFVKKELNLR